MCAFIYYSSFLLTKQNIRVGTSNRVLSLAGKSSQIPLKNADKRDGFGSGASSDKSMCGSSLSGIKRGCNEGQRVKAQ